MNPECKLRGTGAANLSQSKPYGDWRITTESLEQRAGLDLQAAWRPVPVNVTQVPNEGGFGLLSGSSLLQLSYVKNHPELLKIIKTFCQSIPSQRFRGCMF